MSDSIESLRRKIAGAAELQSVVRTMKAIAASRIVQYENSVRSLISYYRTVELGLSVSIRTNETVYSIRENTNHQNSPLVKAIIFGSDQGLVGQFNNIITDFAEDVLSPSKGKLQVWAVGERVGSYITDAGLPILGIFAVPNSVKGITPLIGQILEKSELRGNLDPLAQFHLFYNRPQSRSHYTPVRQRLLPLDEQWRNDLVKLSWPTKSVPEILGNPEANMDALIREYLFVSLFRACAESLASENASRLVAMQRAEKNIDEQLEELNRTFHRLRQSGIDEELFDVVSGFEAISEPSSFRKLKK